MKKVKVIFIALLYSAMAAVHLGCGEDPLKETPEDELLKRLSGRPWAATAVFLDEKDVTQIFEDMVITFSTDHVFTVQNPIPPIWNSNGDYTLRESASGFVLVREDGVNVTLTEQGNNKLILEFTYQAIPDGGRVGSVTGRYKFELTSG